MSEDAPQIAGSQEASPDHGTALDQEGSLDPAQAQYLRDRLQSQENLPLAVGSGLVAALAGAAVWGGITVATEYQIGFMAVGIGFVVGYAVRIAGQGISTPFGVVGAVFSLVGCALGNLLAVTAFVAANEEMPFLDVLVQLDLALIQELMIATFSPMDLLFYAIAIYYGYKLSFRQLTGKQLEGMLTGGGGGDATA